MCPSVTKNRKKVFWWMQIATRNHLIYLDYTRWIQMVHKPSLDHSGYIFWKWQGVKIMSVRHTNFHENLNVLTLIIWVNQYNNMHKNVIAAEIGILESNFSQITTVVLVLCPSVKNLPSKFHSVWKDFSEKKPIMTKLHII